ncbi:hypothetical protein MASR2M29_21910 [Spirochaetota bacterium]
MFFKKYVVPRSVSTIFNGTVMTLFRSWDPIKPHFDKMSAVISSCSNSLKENIITNQNALLE